ncbi:Cuticular protein hypothetical 5 [Operophtera brumata]|uniref:Cuticular protein hypothetical 5 n=1 Tax=Operophtera brumata TaxID=104452 RepID=A0A0L7K402_OPEBR|nr:Cuticular protein hypothetical 5 [Operophtera brumata]
MNVKYTVEGDSGLATKIYFEGNANPFGKGNYLTDVEYTVNGDSGFVPKMYFEENANPFGKGN